LPDHLGGNLEISEQVDHICVDANAQVGVMAEISEISHQQCEKDQKIEAGCQADVP
jgi:hypothetical protein